jgi:hypothetical protein
MSVNKTECLLQAIGKLNGMGNPEAESFSINNPLMVRSWARPGKHLMTEAGFRIFPSILAGIKAGLFDLELKISGHSRAGLKPTDTLANLLGCYGLKEKLAIDNVVNYLRKGLKDATISSKTPLSYFLSETSTQPSTPETR